MSTFTKAYAGFLTAASLLVSGAAHAEAPGWTATTSFSAPKGAAPGMPFAARLDLITTAMTVEADPVLNVPGMRGSGGNIVLSLPNGDAMVVLGRDDYNHSVSDEQLVALIQATLHLSSN